MPHWGPVSRREFVKSLRALGFVGPAPGGRHELMRRGAVALIVPNPHRGDIGVGLLSRVLRQAGVTRAEWESV